MAKGAVKIAPPRFLQKISDGIAIVLIAINGPDEPIPRIPTPSLTRSERAGISVIAGFTPDGPEVEVMTQT
jgi:hypothetical protein